MIPILGPLRATLVALHGGGDPRHLAAGFALGAALGLVPKGNLFALVFFLLFFFFNVNKGLALLSAFFFTAVGYAFDGPAHALGRALLSAAALRPLWTLLYDLPIVPLTRFNNTVVLGNLAIGLILYAPLYAAALRAVALYNERYKAVVERWPFVRALKGWSWYQSYDRWLGQ
jgi:uncharacterized protein (TIGR03546 family)